MKNLLGRIGIEFAPAQESLPPDLDGEIDHRPVPEDTSARAFWHPPSQIAGELFL